MTSLLLFLSLISPSPQIIMENVAAGGSSPVDWTGSFIGVWLMEESSSPSADEAGSSCTDCDFSWVNSISQYTTSNRQGSAAVQALDEGAGGDRLTCDSRPGVGNNCNALEITGDISFGGWVRNEDMDNERVEYINLREGSSGGYRLSNDNNADNDIRCWIGNSANGNIIAEGSSTQADATWYHIVCTYDDDGDGGGDDGLLVYRDGVDDTSGTPTQTDLGAATDSEYFFLDSGGDPDHTAQGDEFFIIDQELTAQQICRICSCGIDGAGCALLRNELL